MEIEKKETLPDIIKDRKALPIELKEKMKDDIFFNCLVFIVILIITLIINVSFKKLSIRDFEKYIDIVQIICGFGSVAGLEIAYRKDSGKMGIYGIELLIFSISVLFVPYMYIVKSNINFMRNVILVFLVYYLAKSIGTLLYKRNKYLKENMSDIKELVKEEKEGYIDEESTKTLKEQKLKEEKLKEEKRKKAREEKAKVKTKNVKKVEDVKND